MSNLEEHCKEGYMTKRKENKIIKYMNDVADIFDNACQTLNVDDFKQLVNVATMFVAGLQNEIDKADGKLNGK